MTKATPRIRGRKLQATRARVLRMNPMCAHCLRKGLVRPAVEVDHILPLFKGGEDSTDNMQGLCAECHKVKTAQDKGHKPRRTIGVDGWPV